ncbi:MAG: hypothetical protein WCW31_05715 [Patescibacteria group bacterium]|jgi:hypothetical protein
MSFKKYFTLVTISFAFGIFFDRLLQDIPYLSLETKISILDLASLLIAVAIAIMIPHYVTKIIEDKRGIKTFLIEEFKELIVILKNIKSKINDAYVIGKLEENDKRAIVYIFFEAELKVNSIREQLEIAFKNKTQNIENDLTDFLFEYNEYVTGGELMNSDFKIDERFYKEHNTEYSKIETGVKNLIQKVYRF